MAERAGSRLAQPNDQHTYRLWRDALLINFRLNLLSSEGFVPSNSSDVSPSTMKRRSGFYSSMMLLISWNRVTNLFQSLSSRRIRHRRARSAASSQIDRNVRYFVSRTTTIIAVIRVWLIPAVSGDWKTRRDFPERSSMIFILDSKSHRPFAACWLTR